MGADVPGRPDHYHSTHDSQPTVLRHGLFKTGPACELTANSHAARRVLVTVGLW
jgi:hypothetical protein